MYDTLTHLSARVTDAKNKSERAVRTSRVSIDYAEEAYREAHEATNLAVMSMAFSIATALVTALMVRLGG